MDKIKVFIECLVPVTACNLKCEYCYVIQENRRTMKMPEFKYDAKTIGEGLSKKRLGGTAYISICGAGETLIPDNIIDIIYELLKQGHYLNITTNGTLTQRFNEIISKCPKEYLERLHFAFSLHYLELIRIKKINDFVNNVKAVQKAGCSFLIQLNLYDGYLPYLEEIKSFCIENFGALPQIAVTRKEDVKKNIISDCEFHTNMTKDEYIKIGSEFDSPLFDYTIQNFMVMRKEFCYAGAWSFILNLATGIARPCYAEYGSVDIFKDVSKKIRLPVVGNNCNHIYCVNSSHFMSLGIIPEKYTKSYEQLRNRETANWYNTRMKTFLNTPLYVANNEYSKIKKKYINSKYNIKKTGIRIKNCVGKYYHKLKPVK